MWVYFWAFHPVPLIYVSAFVPVPYCYDHCSFVPLTELREPNSSSFSFLFQDCFGYLGLLCFHINFRSFCSISMKNATDNLMGVHESAGCLGSTIVLTMLILSIQENLFICLWHLQFLSSVSYSFSSTGLLPPWKKVKSESEVAQLCQTLCNPPGL